MTSPAFSQSLHDLIKGALYYIFTPLSYRIPILGGYLICVKRYSYHNIMLRLVK